MENTSKVDVVQIAYDRWFDIVINPYTKAHAVAYETYKETIKADAEKSKQSLDLVITGLSLCGGSLITAVASSYLKKQLTNKSLDFIVGFNLQKTFNFAAIKIENKAALEFAVGNLVDTVAKSAADKQKKQLEKSLTTDFEPNLHDYIESLNELNVFSKHKAYIALENTDEKNGQKILDSVKETLWCKNAPRYNFYPSNLAEHIELTFYMLFILDKDFLVTEQKTDYMGQTTIIPISTRSISEGEPCYLQSLDLGGGKRQRVIYGDVGTTVIARINVLYSSIVEKNGKFVPNNFYFNKKMDYETLNKARRVLSFIGNLINYPSLMR